MIKPPKLSVIIPVYNTEKYLSKCLDSVINQTLSDIEIIIVNDGSTDNSQYLINEYSKKDERIIAYVKKNGGLSDARNYGIDKATGEFLAFVDSDDYISLEMLEEMYNLALKHESEIVLCDLVKVNEKGEEFRILPQSPQLPNKIVLEEGLTIFGEIGCFACNKIFKKTLFNEHRFKLGIHFEDVELIPKLILDAKIISKINKPFYKYFERQDSITKTHTAKGLDMFLAIDSVAMYFKESKFKHFENELKRFKIIQGYYSYLAYIVFVKDRFLKQIMIEKLILFIKENNLSINDIKKYKRFNKKYINTLPFKKQIFYKISFINLPFIAKI